MNKIDLIIDALEKAKDGWQCFDKYEKALAAARELKALEQPEQESVTHAVIAGVLFDFMGWLTSRQERLVLSASDEASPAVKVIEEFAKMRGLSLDDAKVKDWQDALAQPEQKPVAWVTGYKNGHCVIAPIGGNTIFQTGLALYTAPPKREWVGLHLDDMPETYVGDKSFLHGAKWAEVKLKEKNT